MPVSTADLVSPAMACLRVSIASAPGGQTAESLQHLVAKVINAFLETRWEFPRQFEQMTPYAFVLTDPRAERMDKRALKALAAELQLKLFGAEGEGEVSLLMFEGSDVEVHRFARLAGEALNPPFEGSLDRILAERLRDARVEKAIERLIPAVAAGSVADDDGFEDLAFDPPARPPPAPRSSELESVYSGLYLTLTQGFIGSVALCRRPRRDRFLYPDLGGPEALPGLAPEAFDEGCVESAIQALARDAPGLMFVPLSFTSLVRPLGRRAYARFLCHLPAEHRDRLGAAIYDTPRAPSFAALQTVRRFLDPFFADINLHVADPEFEVEKLAPDLVSSVTLVLPDRESAARIAAVRRFAAQREAYKKRRIWPGVSAVMNQSELEMCLALKVPVIGGPAVAQLGPVAPGVRSIALEDLPFTA
jgi:hypothetical protein